MISRYLQTNSVEIFLQITFIYKKDKFVYHHKEINIDLSPIVLFLRSLITCICYVVSREIHQIVDIFLIHHMY